MDNTTDSRIIGEGIPIASHNNTEVDSIAGTPVAVALHPCDLCRSRRIMCDYALPECQRCIDNKVGCTYSSDRPKSRRRSRYIDMLERKISALESLIESNSKGNKEYSSNIDSSLTVPSTFVSSVKSQQKRQGEEGSVQDDESSPPSLSRKTPEILSDLKSGDAVPTINFNKTFNSSMAGNQPLFDHLIEVYFNHVHNYIGIIHRPTFMMLYQSNSVPEILAWSVFALSARFSHHLALLATPSAPAGRHFADRAQDLFRKHLHKSPSFEDVQAGILMACYEFASGKGEYATYFVGVAQRSAQYIGIGFIDSHMVYNPASPNLLNWHEIETRRRLWWACLQCDIIASSLIGRPLGVDDRDYMVEFPGDDAVWDPSHHYQYKPYYWFQYAAKLTVIWREIYMFIQHRHLRRWYSNSTIRNAFNKLDQDLVAFMQDLPAHMHFSPETNHTLRKEITHHHRATAILHSIYWTVVIMLHRSNLAHGIAQKSVTTFEMRSRDRCVQAAHELGRMVVDFSGHEDKVLDVFTPFAIFNAATIYANLAFAENGDNTSVAKERLNQIRSFLKKTVQSWNMSEMYIEILRLLESILIRDNSSCDTSKTNCSGWQVPTSTSYFQWYFSNLAPIKGE